MPQSTYKNNISQLDILITDQKKKLSRIMYARIFTFLCLILFIVITITSSNLLVLFGLIIPIIIFGILVKANSKEKTILSLLEIKRRINEEELKSIQKDFSSFNNGSVFIDHQHNYSHDIDLFGEKSLFQFLNRTTSSNSEKKLAEIMMTFETNENEIKERQEATKELSEKVEWRQNFRANGIHFQSDKKNTESLLNWNEKEIPIFKKKNLWNTLLVIIPALMFISIICVYYSILPIASLVFILTIPLIITGRHLKLINKQHQYISQYLNVLSQHNGLSLWIEQESFTAEKLISIKNKLIKLDKSASEEINKLAKIAQQIDNRSNPVFAILMNCLFLWDLNYLYKLKKWLQENSNEMKGWFDAIYEMETFTSLGNYHFNNPNNTFPILSKDCVLQADQLAHPLLSKESRIENSLEIKSLEEFVIITGANMAGKSTFLRAIGVNQILAMVGSSVCAKKFVFTPTPLFSSMRTSDSLSENESYFYSELKRLELIVNKLKAGEKLFIILDEILKGTNSKDKAEGSKKFVKQLLKYQAAGIIATHDLSLCTIKDEFPSQIQNHYFDVEIENDNLVFDYKLKEGICSNMNAEFLMKKMGITE